MFGLSFGKLNKDKQTILDQMLADSVNEPIDVDNIDDKAIRKAVKKLIKNRNVIAIPDYRDTHTYLGMKPKMAYILPDANGEPIEVQSAKATLNTIKQSEMPEDKRKEYSKAYIDQLREAVEVTDTMKKPKKSGLFSKDNKEKVSTEVDHLARRIVSFNNYSVWSKGKAAKMPKRSRGRRGGRDSRETSQSISRMR
jgi:hypothetical protein